MKTTHPLRAKKQPRANVDEAPRTPRPVKPKSTNRVASPTTPPKPIDLLSSSGLPQKAKGLELHKNYRVRIELCLIASLLAIIGLTVAPLFPSQDGYNINLGEQEVVQLEQIQQTTQMERPPAPPRPPVPVEVPNDEVLEDTELDLDAALDLNEPLDFLPPPPPAPVAEEVVEEEEMEVFVAVEQMPEIVGGNAKIYEVLEYPEIARQAGMEGMVVVQFVVEPNGTPTSPVVVRSAGASLDEAALAAVKKLTFKPGLQRGKPVRVRFAIPIRFRLRDARK